MTCQPLDFSWNFCPICGKALVPAHDGERERPHCVDCRRFYYRNPVPAVCCFITRNDHELLLAQRAVEPCRGEWSLPGGFVELGETTEEAIVREILEETSLVANGLRLIGVSTQVSPFYGGVTVLGYVISEWHGQLLPNSDALDLRFFSRDQRPPLPFRAHRELLELFDALP